MENQPKKMCWYNPDIVIEEMNRFYDVHVKGHEITEHMKGFTNLLALVEPKGAQLIDLGTGTAMISEFCKEFQYHGSDLAHIVYGCAMRNYPQYFYRACDLIEDDISWISNYPVVSLNGLIDIMPAAINVLASILNHARDYVLIHRQEITEQGETRQIENGAYGGYTYHSIISRKDFNALLDEYNFEIVKEEQLCFTNWENNGSSFLLKKRKSWSLHQMDHQLNQIFKGKRNGFYLEAGANNGLCQSVTKFFEFYKEWTGILIEPIESNYLACKENRNRNNIFVQAALVSSQYKEIEIGMMHAEGTGGLMSFVNDAFNPAVEQQYNKLSKELLVPKQVPAKTLDEILRSIWNEQLEIDLAVIDLEGYEFEALNGIDFNRWQINWLLVESRQDMAPDSWTLLVNLLNPYYDYHAELSEQDYLFKRKS